MSSGVAIIAVGPTGFPGASQIMCHSLRLLADGGCVVVFVGWELPFYFSVNGLGGIRFEKVDGVSGGAVREGGAARSADVLFVATLVEALARLVDELSREYRVLIWGTYLFPYGLAAIMAHRISGAAEVIITPTGSDVWELGPRLCRLGRGILNDAGVRCITAYTEVFAREIADTFGVEREIEVVRPSVDICRFRPASPERRQVVRERLGIPADAFVISNHSNMRPVKRPDDVLLIAAQVAQALHRPTVLLMIGPSVPELARSFEHALHVVWTGVARNVEDLLCATDLELNCSQHDSFNLSIAEAMAAGVPCATTDVAGIARDLMQSGGGYVFPLDLAGSSIDRYGSAVEFIVSCAQDEGRRMEMAGRVREYAIEKFSDAGLLLRLSGLVDHRLVGDECVAT